jgi:MFS family permease
MNKKWKNNGYGDQNNGRGNPAPTATNIMTTNKPTQLLIYLTAFICGAGVLVLEIVGTRIMAPFYGSTIYVWTALITVTLASLAVGYWAGGKLADRFPNSGTLFVAVGLSGMVILLIPVYANGVLLVSDMGGMRLGPILAAAALFGLPIVLLGTVTPLMVKLVFSSSEHLGVTTGNIYALMTVGSLCGALVSGFYLAQSVTVTGSFVGVGSILLLLAVAGIGVNRIKKRSKDN